MGRAQPPSPAWLAAPRSLAAVFFSNPLIFFTSLFLPPPLLSFYPTRSTLLLFISIYIPGWSRAWRVGGSHPFPFPLFFLFSPFFFLRFLCLRERPRQGYELMEHGAGSRSSSSALPYWGVPVEKNPLRPLSLKDVSGGRKEEKEKKRKLGQQFPQMLSLQSP